MTEIVSAYAPCHVSTLFVPVITDSPETTGSLGTGFSIFPGVYTTVKILGYGSKRVKWLLNGEPVQPENLSTSFTVFEKMLEIYGGGVEMEISQWCYLPIGGGFGVSGASALSLSLALNEALGLGLNTEEAAMIAHVSEVINKTGLGDVISSLAGGFEIRVKAGGPGHGAVKKWEPELYVSPIIIYFSSIETRKVLRDNALIQRISESGKELLQEFLKDIRLEKFIEVSRKFTETIGLCPEEVETVMSKFVMSSMVMLGNSAFIMVHPEEIHPTISTLREMFPNATIIEAKIDYRGAKVIT